MILGVVNWDSWASLGEGYSLYVLELWLQPVLCVAVSEARQLQKGGSDINHPVKLSTFF